MASRKHKKISAKDASSEQFINSSIIRFGRLKDYIQEKLLVDYFAVIGNIKMIEGLDKYIQDNLKKLKSAKKINILDIGPAIGALSSMLALQQLEKYDLLEKTQIHLLDVSKNVIEQTQLCNFFYPDGILDKKLKGKIFKKLRESKAEIVSAEAMPYKNGQFDITLACFVFHHMHDSIKPLAAKEVIRTLKPNGFVGIAEEWFKDYQDDYAIGHVDDAIPLALESIISYKKLSKLLPELEIIFKYDTTHKGNSYAFCGIKR